jgi:hypothetical protein
MAQPHPAHRPMRMSGDRRTPSLLSRCAAMLLPPVNAADLLASLEGLAGARPVAVSPPLVGSSLVAGIEVAVAPPAEELALRRAWRERHRSGATPLLLLTDDPTRPETLLTVGPLDEGGTLHRVAVDAVADLLRRVSSMPSLEAVRELAAELDRLDQAGLPGVNVRVLLTQHTLERLRGNAPRWTRARETVKGLGRESDWRAVLTGLGYALERRKQRGWLVRYDRHPIIVVHPKQSAAEFARLDNELRPPEGSLLNDAADDGAPFGILAAGGRLRLFQTEPAIGSSTASYLDLDAATMQDDDRPFLAILGPDYLASHGFADLVDEARNFGAKLRVRLDETLRQQVLPALARSLGDWSRTDGQDPAADEVREELERAALTLVFRALFVLYAESAQYLPMDNRLYRQNSLTGLVEEAAETQERLGAKSTALWGRFRILVDAMRTGNDAWSVPAYFLQLRRAPNR